ncbi:hypothetical protein [Motiliproteus sp. SC1-56]|uniref:hypothetical protein n=1 Tax=Motiliproteus sp. SC1-56 TaxID=2799565 RepID=UPI001A8C76FD|nr:hypothetical protein [Motiliproteus sp. SC1-56]
MELEITWKRAVRVWWSYLWRNLLAIAASAIVGGIIGVALGFILSAMGLSSQSIQNITGPIGGVLGLLLSIIPIKMILGKDFGEFRLVLVKNQSTDITI